MGFSLPDFIRTNQMVRPQALQLARLVIIVQELDDVCPQLAGGQCARHHATTSSTTAIGRGLTGPLKGTSRRVRFPELM